MDEHATGATTYDEKKLGELLDAGKRAVARARFVLLAITIAGVLMLSAQFNLYAPWLRNNIDKAPGSEEQRQIVSLIYRDLQTLAVPIFGVRLSAYDLSIIGSVAMLLLAFWFFYCLRREHHVIWRILEEAGKGPDEMVPHRAAYLYHSIVHPFVFNPLGEIPLIERVGARCMFYMPFWTVFAISVVDIASIFSKLTLGIPKDVKIFDWTSVPEINEALFRCAFGLVLSLLCSRVVKVCMRYHNNTLLALYKLMVAVQSIKLALRRFLISGKGSAWMPLNNSNRTCAMVGSGPTG
ncbi:MAG TPA: hypothetical protein VMV69_01495 [Pirellulales bacterium]|nr:hypothetical protein [Pirellulales bacterium]